MMKSIMNEMKAYPLCSGGYSEKLTRQMHIDRGVSFSAGMG